ncbi:MAG: DUF4843 domain-containing protein [Odoribacteraceae bacterium]|jgi:hypothetical protein|nr:DUF4843 domain-containing protein [Odoribacteraceae bacterium]
MKQQIYHAATALLLLLATACTQEKPMPFLGDARVQLKDTTILRHTFIYSAAEVSRDTLYIQVNTIGEMADHDRQVNIIQVPEYDITLVTDPVTNRVDTITTERPNKAVPGTHYIPLDDPALRPHAVIKARTVTAMIPIILLRDASLKTDDYRLRLQLAPSEDFNTGERRMIARTILFSDRLVQPSFWDINVNYTFGAYSTRKHQFMIDVSGEKIDNEWYDANVRNVVGASQQYKNFFKAALARFNADPDNIASGAAPLRETDDPASPLVTFPN